MENSGGYKYIKVEKLRKDAINDYKEYSQANPSGAGISLPSDSGLVSVMAAFLGKIGSHIMSGSFDLTTLLAPSSCMCSITMCEAYANAFQHKIKYFKEASELHKSAKIERIKLIAAGLIADLPFGIIETQAKPPIPSFPGEYFEGLMNDGTYIKVEQIARGSKCLNSKINVTGPDGAFKIYMEMHSFAYCRGMTDMNCIIVGNDGKFEIELKDGTKYEYFEPQLMLHDYLKQNRLAQFFIPEKTFRGVLDKTNNMLCEFSMPEPDRSWSSYATSWLWNKTEVGLDKRCLIN